MAIYFFVHDADFFCHQLAPALAAAWRQRSFAPCRSLCEALRPVAAAFAERYHTGADQPLLARAGLGLPFDRDVWRLLAGEFLLYGAQDIPDIQTAPDTLTCLLAPQVYQQGESARPHSALIQQAHHGSRDLVFGGGYYRPEHAGWNDRDDLARLADYLGQIDPAQWTVADLATLRGIEGAEDRADELEFAREWFPELAALYKQARDRHQVLVCENIVSAGLD
jgi:hypothetical protein